jgi:LmbE family N-acetylglucosaminyl deacetylase
MPEFVETAPASALAVYAHPDDAEISCGGTLARWAAAGSEVHVLVCTTGDKGSSDPKTDPKSLARRRAKETTAAAKVLGLAGHDNLGLPDGELDNTTSVREAIVAYVRTVRPDVVICPDPTAIFFGDRYFNHHDHRATGWATLDAVSPAAGNPHYFPDAGAVHNVSCMYLSGTLDPNVWVDITDTLERKIDALFCHASQLVETGEWFRAFLRQRAEEAGRAAGVSYAEGFRRLAFAS